MHNTLESIHDLISKIRDSGKLQNESLWFRGHSNVSWSLTPTIFRYDDYTINLEMSKIKLFKEHAAPLIKDRIPTQVQDWLVMMRHYHFPTRILDWTENPLIALYFALLCDHNTNSALFMLNPHKLNESNKLSDDSKIKSLPSFDDEETLKEYLPNGTSNSNVLANVVAFSTPRFFDRLQRQLGTFTIHLNKKSLESNVDKSYLTKFIIPKKSRTEIMKELDILKINKFTVYPELAYLYEGINNE